MLLANCWSGIKWNVFSQTSLQIDFRVVNGSLEYSTVFRSFVRERLLEAISPASTYQRALLSRSGPQNTVQFRSELEDIFILDISQYQAGSSGGGRFILPKRVMPRRR